MYLHCSFTPFLFTGTRLVLSRAKDKGFWAL
jgi:hypothetical protein